jgi:DNA-binding NarL/FixJ family response regulator
MHRTGDPARVLLADGNVTVRSAVRLLLEQLAGATVIIQETAEPHDLVAQARAGSPDLLLVDWEFCRSDPAALVTRLREVCPGLKVIVLSSHPEAQAPALAAGVDGFVYQGDPPERLVEALVRAGVLL